MAREVTVQLDVEVGEGRASLDRLEEGFKQAEIAAVEFGGGVERSVDNAQSGMLRLSEATEQTQQQMDAMNRASGRANEVLFNLGDIVQDAQFGIRGVANNIPLLIEQFGRLQKDAGGTNAAFSTLASSLTGTGGIIVAVNALMALGPQLISFFTETEESASEAASSIEDTADAISDFQGFEVAGLEITPSDIQPTLQRLREEQQRIQFQRENLREQLQEAQQQAGRGAAAQQLFQVQTQAIRSQLQELKTRDNQAAAFIEKLQKQREQLQQQRDFQHLIKEATGLTVDEQGNLTDQTEETTDAAKEQAQAFNGLRVSAQDAAENMQMIERFMAGRDLSNFQRQLQRFGQRRTPTVGGAMLRGGETPRQQAAQAVREIGPGAQFQNLSQILGGQGQTPEGPSGLDALGMSLEEIQQEYDVSKKKAEQFKQAAESRFGQVANAAASMGQALVSALQGGKKEAQDIAGILLQGVGGVLSAIPGVGTVAGPVLSGVGGIVGSFQHGGRVNTPLQIVGEAGPEIAALPEGSNVTSNRETERMLAGQGGGMEATERLRESVEQQTQQLGRAIGQGLTRDPFADQAEAEQFENIAASEGAFQYEGL